ncbi:hypothetical protein Tcan_17682 [Toxocara canis]|uniref:Uncharacterized protein n=1 Tax=Toxocara canis TaxID=6265 RepID=A0A0B2UYU9_TOXCA|nr:hypothetical protein Tcan_17682 [Toxocara canis]
MLVAHRRVLIIRIFVCGEITGSQIARTVRKHKKGTKKHWRILVVLHKKMNQLNSGGRHASERFVNTAQQNTVLPMACIAVLLKPQFEFAPRCARSVCCNTHTHAELRTTLKGAGELVLCEFDVN